MRGPGPQLFWLVPPRCGLHAETAVLSAAGSGKTSCCTHLLARQMLGWNADDLDLRQEGSALEVRGPFCYRVGRTLRGWRPPQGLCRTELGRGSGLLGFRTVAAAKKSDLGSFCPYLHGPLQSLSEIPIAAPIFEAVITVYDYVNGNSSPEEAAELFGDTGCCTLAGIYTGA